MKKKLFLMNKVMVSVSSVFMFFALSLPNQSSWLLWGETKCPKTLRR